MAPVQGQLDFLAPTVGAFRHGQPETARAAAVAATPRTGTQRAAVLNALALAGERGATDYELGLAAHTVRPHVAGTRRKDLERRGYVEATNERRATDTGSPAVVWRITGSGLAAWRAMTEGDN